MVLVGENKTTRRTNWLEIKENGLDAVKTGGVVYINVHEPPVLTADEPLYLIYKIWRLLFASGTDTTPSSSIFSINVAALL